MLPVSSTSSTILSQFSPSKAPSKMIDYCLVFRPPAGSSAAEAINEKRRTRPGNTINHSDSGSLCSCPIGLSVEVKSPGGDMMTADLQMGTWHAAQWRSLGLGVSATSIEFLPGILVQGHDWFFVATVPPADHASGSRAHPTFYTKIRLGSTDQADSVCKIIAALLHLVRWLEQRYWPAFQKQVLT